MARCRTGILETRVVKNRFRTVEVHELLYWRFMSIDC